MERTLLLSTGYEPLRVISWKRAVTMLSLGKIEIIETYDREIKSTSIVLKMPAVARLVNTFKRKHRTVKFGRLNIYARDRYQCQYCGQKKTFNALTFDHVIPRCKHKGPNPTTWENIVTCCKPCNTKKADRTPKQAGMSLLKHPKKPNWLPSIIITINQKKLPPQWKSFLYYKDKLWANT